VEPIVRARIDPSTGERDPGQSIGWAGLRHRAIMRVDMMAR